MLTGDKNIGIDNGTPIAYILVAARAFFIPVSTASLVARLARLASVAPLGYATSIDDASLGIPHSVISLGSILSIANIPRSCILFLTDPLFASPIAAHVCSPSARARLPRASP